MSITSQKMNVKDKINDQKLVTFTPSPGGSGGQIDRVVMALLAVPNESLVRLVVVCNQHQLALFAHVR